jgi:hypothetical protein
MSTGASDLSSGTLLAIVTSSASDWLCNTLGTVLAGGASETVINGSGTCSVEVGSWRAFARLSSGLTAIVTGRALAESQISDGIVVTLVALWAHLTLVHEDALVPAGVGAWWALVHVGIVNEFVAENGAPHALRARIVVIATPFTDPTGLAATTVRDLSLCRLHAHGFEGASCLC